MDSKLTIGQVATMLGTKISTIRFYQRIGLTEEPPKKDAGFRYYSDQDIARLRIILNAKSLGFTLEETRRLLNLDRRHCGAIQLLFKTKVEEVRMRISLLEDVCDSLLTMIEDCSPNEAAGECPVIVRLEGR